MTNKVANKPLVSVVIPSYNHAAYIEEAIASVIDQTYKDFELIVIDDGSQDNSPDIIKNLAEKHGFKFFRQENQGLSATLNRALKESAGRYFVPFSSDDIMFKDRLEKQVAYMEGRPELAVCGGNIVKINEKGEVAEKQKHNPEETLEFEDIFLDKKPGLPAPTLFFRKRVLSEAGGYDPDIRLEDLYIQLAISRKGYCLGYMEDKLAYYRVHPTNTYKDLSYMFENVMDTYKKFSDHPGYEKVKNKFLNSLFLKAAKKDKKYAVQILKLIPFKGYKLKTVRGLLKLITPRLKKDNQ